MSEVGRGRPAWYRFTPNRKGEHPREHLAGFAGTIQARPTFYRWYEHYRTGGPEALADRPSKPDRVWNRIDDVRRAQIISPHTNSSVNAGQISQINSS